MEALKNRLTVVDRIYHQVPGEQPTFEEYRFSKLLESDEPPFVRPSLKLTEEWTLLETAWIKDAGTVTIFNESGKSIQTNPTPEETNELAKHQIAVCFQPKDSSLLVDMLLVDPGSEERLTPSPQVNVYLRSVFGETKASVIVYPR